jgi:ABC-type Fe3+ transport system permease subunit
VGLTKARQLLVPSLVLGWAWRLWVYLATLFAALVPFFKTHFFDRSQGNIPRRLLETLGASVVEGLIAGLLVWGIAVWMAYATHVDFPVSPREGDLE